jgi:hypothetical protein
LDPGYSQWDQWHRIFIGHSGILSANYLISIFEILSDLKKKSNG